MLRMYSSDCETPSCSNTGNKCVIEGVHLNRSCARGLPWWPSAGVVSSSRAIENSRVVCMVEASEALVDASFVVSGLLLAGKRTQNFKFMETTNLWMPCWEETGSVRTTAIFPAISETFCMELVDLEVYRISITTADTLTWALPCLCGSLRGCRFSGSLDGSKLRLLQSVFLSSSIIRLQIISDIRGKIILFSQYLRLRSSCVGDSPMCMQAISVHPHESKIQCYLAFVTLYEEAAFFLQLEDGQSWGVFPNDYTCTRDLISLKASFWSDSLWSMDKYLSAVRFHNFWLPENKAVRVKQLRVKSATNPNFFHNFEIIVKVQNTDELPSRCGLSQDLAVNSWIMTLSSEKV